MLTTKRKQEIKGKVDEIIRNNDLNVPAFDLVHFLINKENFKIIQQKMKENETGLIAINDDGVIKGTTSQRLIAVNSMIKNEANFIQRRRFIIAHEYGHFILHKNNKSLYAKRDTFKKESTDEIEADYFARCLLMPENLVTSVLTSDYAKEMSDRDKIALIARTFNVTKKKALHRVEEIGKTAV